MQLKPANINVSNVSAFMDSAWQNMETELIARNIVLTQQKVNPNEWTPFTWEEYVERCNHNVTENERRVLDVLVLGGYPVWNTNTALRPGYLKKDADGCYMVTDQFLEVISKKTNTSTKNTSKPLFLNDLRSTRLSPVKKAMKFTDSDVGKIFVVNTEKTAGKIVSPKEFHKMDLTLIGEWEDITEWDVFCSKSRSD